MSEQEHPFQPGVEVVLVRYPNFGVPFIKKGRVAKVHKSGNFTLDGDPQQYRAGKSYAEAEWCGNATGRSYHSMTVYLRSSKWDAEIAKQALTSEFFSIIRKLDELTRGDRCRAVASAETLAAAKALLAAIKAENEGQANADAA